MAQSVKHLSDSWFLLRSCSQGREIEPAVRLCAGRGECLSLASPSLCPSPCHVHTYTHTLSHSLSLQGKKKKNSLGTRSSLTVVISDNCTPSIITIVIITTTILIISYFTPGFMLSTKISGTNLLYYSAVFLFFL